MTWDEFRSYKSRGRKDSHGLRESTGGKGTEKNGLFGNMCVRECFIYESRDVCTTQTQLVLLRVNRERSFVLPYFCNRHISIHANKEGAEELAARAFSLSLFFLY